MMLLRIIGILRVRVIDVELGIVVTLMWIICVFVVPCVMRFIGLQGSVCATMGCIEGRVDCMD